MEYTNMKVREYLSYVLELNENSPLYETNYKFLDEYEKFHREVRNSKYRKTVQEKEVLGIAKRKTGCPVTKDTLLQIEEKRKEGLSYSEIATTLSVSFNTVSRVLRYSPKIRTLRASGPVTDDKLSLIRTKHNEGMSQREIAEAVMCSYSTIRRALRDNYST